MATYDYLRERIQNNVWLGKEILQISDTVWGAINAPREWFINLPPVRAIMELPPFAAIREMIDTTEDLYYVVNSCSLIFLESAYGINKAFNSKTYSSLESTGQRIIDNLATGEREVSIYKNAILAHNETLNLPRMNSDIQQIESQLRGIQVIGESALTQMERWEEAAIGRLEETRDTLSAQVESLTGSARTKARRIINRINKMLGQIFNRDVSSRLISSRSPGAIVPIVVGVPTVVGAVGVVGAIASFLLSGILLKALVDFPMQLLGGLVQATTSIVLKFLGGAGADACRYLAAAVLKSVPNLLPKIFAVTGMVGSAWSFMMAYAPYIIIAAIIIILAIRANSETLGEFLYVFGVSGTRPDLSFSRVIEMDSLEIRDTLADSAIKLKNQSGKDYREIYGFALDDDDRVTLGLDLSVSPPRKLIKSEANAIFSGLSPLLDNFF